MSFSWSAEFSDGQNTFDILNTENLIISTITEEITAKKYSIKFHLGGQFLCAINLIQTPPHPTKYLSTLYVWG